MFDRSLPPSTSTKPGYGVPLLPNFMANQQIDPQKAYKLLCPEREGSSLCARLPEAAYPLD